MNNRNPAKIKVLYIAGPSRTGSTILSQILGEIPNFFNAGELFNYWDRGIKNQGLCSCGQSVNDCGVWKPITRGVVQNPRFKQIDALIKIRDRLVRSRKVPLFDLDKKLASFNSGNDSRVYLENLAGLYQSIVNTTACRVIIDSSKSIGYAYYLAKTGIIDLYIVHLIRDSRATAYSWLHQKGELSRINPFSASLVWNSRNLKAEIMGRQLKGKYVRIFYEDFVKEPKKVVREILETINVPPELVHIPFLSAQEVRLSQGHMIFGNPDRFNSGIKRLANDYRWRHMRLLDKLIVTFLTWPFLIKYRYSIFMTNDKRADISLRKSQSSHPYRDFPEPFCSSSCASPRAHHADGR